MVAADREALQRVDRRWASRTAADARSRFGRLLPRRRADGLLAAISGLQA